MSLTEQEIQILQRWNETYEKHKRRRREVYQLKKEGKWPQTIEHKRGTTLYPQTRAHFILKQVAEAPQHVTSTSFRDNYSTARGQTFRLLQADLIELNHTTRKLTITAEGQKALDRLNANIPYTVYFRDIP